MTDKLNIPKITRREWGIREEEPRTYSQKEVDDIQRLARAEAAAVMEKMAKTACTWCVVGSEHKECTRESQRVRALIPTPYADALREYISEIREDRIDTLAANLNSVQEDYLRLYVKFHKQTYALAEELAKASANAINNLFCDKHKLVAEAAIAGYLQDECPTCELAKARESVYIEAQDWFGDHAVDHCVERCEWCERIKQARSAVHRAAPDSELCPKCKGKLSSGPHGTWCPKPTCKWGWEIELDGSPLKPPAAAPDTRKG